MVPTISDREDRPMESKTTARTLMNAYAAKYGTPQTDQEAERQGEWVGSALLWMRDRMVEEFGPKLAKSWFDRQTEWLADNA